eukprot:850480_1
MSAATALPPAPSGSLPPPPEGGAATAFEPPPLAVLPGDDLTRFILHNPPPANFGSSPRKKKKSRSNKSSNAAGDGDEDATKMPPKIGAGLICTHQPKSTADTANSSDSPPISIKSTIAGRLLYRPSSRTWYIASNPRRYHLAQSPLSS